MMQSAVIVSPVGQLISEIYLRSGTVGDCPQKYRITSLMFLQSGSRSFIQIHSQSNILISSGIHTAQALHKFISAPI